MAGIKSKKYDTASVGGVAPSTKVKTMPNIVKNGKAKTPTLMGKLRKAAGKSSKIVMKMTGHDMASVKKRMATKKAAIKVAGKKLKTQAVAVAQERKKRTGSGKPEQYLNAADRLRATGRGVQPKKKRK